MRALPPPPIILTAMSSFQRPASRHFLRRPRTGKIATSVITRLYAEKAARVVRPNFQHECGRDAVVASPRQTRNAVAARLEHSLTGKSVNPVQPHLQKY